MTRTTPPLVPEVSFEFEGETFTAVADHMMIVRYERLADRSFAYILLHLERVQQLGELPKFSELGFLVQAMLLAHHPDIDLETAMKMAASEGIMRQIGEALGQSLPAPDEGRSGPLAKAAMRSPKKTSGTGKSRSGAGSKRAAKSKASGG
jgi:hypothetical protein